MRTELAINQRSGWASMFKNLAVILHVTDLKSDKVDHDTYVTVH